MRITYKLFLALLLSASLAAAEDRCHIYGLVGDLPVVGDWTGIGRSHIGIFRDGNWHLDANGNGEWDGCDVDLCFGFGLAGDLPVVGDWDGDGRDEIGVFRNANWHLDLNGDGSWDGCGVDGCAVFGLSGDLPAVADWNGDGSDEIGVFRQGHWGVDSNGNLAWDAGTDATFDFGGGMHVPAPGDWTGGGVDLVGVHRPGEWTRDVNGNRVWDGPSVDQQLFFDNGGGIPLLGDWNGDGRDEMGLFNGASWSLDADADGQWSGCNRAPVAVDDTGIVTTQGEEVIIAVLENDHDPDGDPLSLPPNTTVSGPHNGSAGRISSTHMRYTPNPSFVGTDTFQYRVRDPSGAESIARVWVEVVAPTQTEITGVTPDIARHGSVTRIRVRGLHFDSPLVYIGTEEPTSAGRVFPTANLLGTNATGTTLTIDIDATAPGIEGWYTLYVETPSGGAATLIRVVTNEPVVDAWTPVEAATGNTYVLTVLGVNLAGVSVTPSDPGIELLDLDNSDDESLHGILYVAEGTSIGDGNLLLHGGGGSVVLPLDVIAATTTPSKQSSEIAGHSTDSRGQAIAEAPPIVLQELKYSPAILNASRNSAVLEGRREDLATKNTDLCFTVFAQRHRSSSRTLVRLFDLLSGLPLSLNRLQQLGVGDSIQIGSTVLRVWSHRTVTTSVTGCAGEGLDGFLCFFGEIGVMVPFVGGQVFRFGACFGNGEPMGFFSLEASGFIANFEWNSSCGCFRATDQNPGSLSGQRSGLLEVLECGTTSLSLNVQGQVFNEGFVLDDEVAQVTPMECENASQTVRIEVRAFIPFNWVSQPIAFFCNRNFLRRRVINAGDDRGFHANPPPGQGIPGSPPAYRLQHKVEVSPQAGNGLPRGEIPGTRDKSAGRSDEFERSSTLATLGKIDPTDYDSDLGDCYLFHESITLPDPEIAERFFVQRLSSRTVKVLLGLSGPNPTAPVGPDLDFEVDLKITDGGEPGVFEFELKARHDCMPAYEIYMNDVRIYGFLPSSGTELDFLLCLPAPMNISEECTGTLDRFTLTTNCPRG